MLCGLCLPHCPTYRHDRVEGEGPRGRIRLAEGLASARLDRADAGAWSGLDHCLGCRRCEAVCPAGVQYGDLLVAARALQRQQRPPPVRQRLLEGLVARPRLLGAALATLRRLRPLLPGRLRRQVPPIPPAARWPAVTAAVGRRRGSVALFLGCLARRLDLPVQRAAISVLTRLGWEVHLPPGQGCCGALHLHAGAEAGARRLGRANATAFADGRHAAVLVSASGCFDSLRQSLPEATPPVRELLEFIAADPQLAALRLRPLATAVALHVPCTQGSVVAAPDAAAALLRRIPGLVLHPVAGHGCCGAAGNHVLLQAGRAAALREPLLDAIVASAAPRGCSGNIGCRLHIVAGLAARGQPITMQHPIELLAEALP